MAIISFSSFLSLDDYYTKEINQKEFFNNAGVIIDKIHTDFYNELRFVTDKYRDNLTLVDVANGTSREDFFKELIAEKEYKEIINIINLNTQDIGVIYAYLKVFEFLRGTKAGVNTVFNLLGYKDLNNVPNSPKGFLIKEWWEYETKKERMTYDLTLVMPFESYSSYFIQNVRKFLSFYVYPLLKTLLVDILVDFAEIKQGVILYKDKIITTENYNNSLYASVVIYKDKTIFSTPLPPPLPIGVEWNHEFNSLNPLLDSSTYNNNLVEKKGLGASATAYSWYHEFNSLNPLVDSSVNGNNLVAYTDPTVGYIPIGDGSGASKYAFSSPTARQLVLTYPNGIPFDILYNFQITFEISPNADMSNSQVFKAPIPASPLFWSNQVLDINGVAVHETVINNSSIGVVDAATKLIADPNFLTTPYYTRWKIGSSNWSNIYTMQSQPVVF